MVSASDVAFDVQNASPIGAKLFEGTPLYSIGGDGDTVFVDACDYTNPSKMPCIGILDRNLEFMSTGKCIKSGDLSLDIEEEDWDNGDQLYVGIGTLTPTPPEDGWSQAVAFVRRNFDGLKVDIVVNIPGGDALQVTGFTPEKVEELLQKVDLANLTKEELLRMNKRILLTLSEALDTEVSEDDAENFSDKGD